MLVHATLYVCTYTCIKLMFLFPFDIVLNKIVVRGNVFIYRTQSYGSSVVSYKLNWRKPLNREKRVLLKNRLLEPILLHRSD